MTPQLKICKSFQIKKKKIKQLKKEYLEIFGTFLIMKKKKLL